MRYKIKLSAAGVVVAVCSAAIVTLLILLILAVREMHGEFDYTTADGRTGTAKYCTVNSGGLFCRDEDETMLEVVRYRKVN